MKILFYLKFAAVLLLVLGTGLITYYQRQPDSLGYWPMVMARNLQKPIWALSIIVIPGWCLLYEELKIIKKYFKH